MRGPLFRTATDWGTKTSGAACTLLGVGKIDGKERARRVLISRRPGVDVVSSLIALCTEGDAGAFAKISTRDAGAKMKFVTGVG